MGCPCNGTSTSDMWINVQANGQPTAPMTKAQAQESQRANGGYLRRA
jgi:hypothetical protein